jgi:hypothetical protein
MTQHETRTAIVDLSRYHAGQTVEPSAEVRAAGHYYPVGRGRVAWRADRWQAIHRVLDRSDMQRTETVSPWYPSLVEAERWLMGRGLVLGGAYWHTARPETALVDAQ